MLARRFALSLIFIVLAMVGGAGAALETISHEAEHCSACEGAARPVSKTSPIGNLDVLQRLNAKQQISPRDLSRSIVSSIRPFPNNPSVSHRQVLLI
jgi:hypothetical protein